MTEINSFDYYETKCADEFRDLFSTTIDPKLGLDGSKDIRNYFFEWFGTEAFREIYQRIALELASKFNISTNDFLIQSVPTPRIFRPGTHGTNWHTDYWYGHGNKSRTVWVPIKNAVSGATFSAIAKQSDNQELLAYYKENPNLLAKNLDLLGFETLEVLPPVSNVAIFSSQILHGSVLNNTHFERLSFDFRFTVKDDITSTKDLESYLCLKDGKLATSSTNRTTSKFLKYICGGQGIDTSAQHILIENMTHRIGIEITAQEAEIERFGKPMLEFHKSEIVRGNSQFNGIAIASKSILTDKEMDEIASDKKIPIYFALENTWL